MSDPDAVADVDIEEIWKRLARQPLTQGAETHAWRLARYSLMFGSPLDAESARKLSTAYLQLLNQVGRAGV